MLLALLFVACGAAELETSASWESFISSSPVSRNVTLRALKSIAKEEAAAHDSDVVNAEDPMKLILFSNEAVEHFGARCLDGSPSGYYYREGIEKDSFVIFLQGGGLCVTPIDCHKRKNSRLGSSKFWAPTHTDDSNILSTEAWNPFANWSHVWVPYGSGDLYIGTQRRSNLFNLYFSGHNTMKAIVSNLLNETALGSAKRVLLSGASAGGIGTFQNADWLHATLKEAGAPPELQFRASPQAGAFFVNSDIVLYPEFTVHLAANFASFAASYLYNWFGALSGGPFSRPYLDQDCMAANPKTPHQCWSAVHHYPYINTSLYIAQNKYDSNQAGSIFGADWWPLHGKRAKYIRYFGNKTIEGIAHSVLTHGPNKVHPDGIFMPSCWAHTGNLCVRGGSIIQGTSYAQSLSDWFHGGNAHSHQLIDDCKGADPCNSYCAC